MFVFLKVAAPLFLEVANNVHVRLVPDQNISHPLSGCGISKLYHIALVGQIETWIHCEILQLKVHGAN